MLRLPQDKDSEWRQSRVYPSFPTGCLFGWTRLPPKPTGALMYRFLDVFYPEDVILSSGGVVVRLDGLPSTNEETKEIRFNPRDSVRNLVLLIIHYW